MFLWTWMQSTVQEFKFVCIWPYHRSQQSLFDLYLYNCLEWNNIWIVYEYKQWRQIKNHNGCIIIMYYTKWCRSLGWANLSLSEKTILYYTKLYTCHCCISWYLYINQFIGSKKSLCNSYIVNDRIYCVFLIN